MSDDAGDPTPKKRGWKLAAFVVACILAFAFLQIGVFVLLQFLATIGVLPTIFRLDAAAVEVSVAGLDFVARVAWPLALIVLVLLFADDISKRIPDIIRAKVPGAEFDLERRKEERSDQAKEILVLRGAVEEMRAAIATKPPERVAEGERSVTFVPDPKILAKEKQAKEKEINQREEQLYGPIADALGEIHNALLLCLHKLTRPKMVRLAAGLGISMNTVRLELETLRGQGLVFKEGKGIPYRPTELGRLYLEWLERTRPETFKRATERYSGV